MSTEYIYPMGGASSKPTYKELSIENHNNKLASECFIVVDLAPDKQRIPARSELEGRIYAATHNKETMYVKIIDLLFVSFAKLTDHITLWSNCLNADEFRASWLQKHPETKPDTEMIIYYYQKLKEDQCSCTL